MKITGVAPKIAVPTFIYLLITIVIDAVTSPAFKITQTPFLLSVIGIILIITGAFIVAMVGIKLQRSFRKDILMTDGFYRYVRNPMYDAYLLFVIPGICLLFNSWLVLTTVILNFILLIIFIKEEYRYLENKFGEEYHRYLQRVWVRFI